MTEPREGGDEGAGDRAASWPTAVRGVVDAFVAGVGESTRQLSSAAERFMSETLDLVESAAARVEESIARNGELSKAAERAAEEARSAAATAAADALAAANERFQAEAASMLEQMNANVEQSAARSTELADRVERSVDQARQAVDTQVQQAMSGASERLSAESRSLIDEIGTRARQAEENLALLQSATDEAAEQARAVVEKASSDLEGRSNEVIARLTSQADQSLTRMVEMGDYAQRAADSARFAAEQATGAGQEAGAGPAALDELQRGSEETLARASEMAAAAERAAEAARAAAEDARASVERGGASEGSAWAPDTASTVLDRLEADYSLLTTVVQELSDRIASLSSLAPVEAPEYAVAWQSYETTDETREETIVEVAAEPTAAAPAATEDAPYNLAGVLPEEGPEESGPPPEPLRIVDLSFPAYGSPIDEALDAGIDEPTAAIESPVSIAEEATAPTPWPGPTETEEPLLTPPPVEAYQDYYSPSVEQPTSEIEAPAAPSEEEPSAPLWPAALEAEPSPVPDEPYALPGVELAPAHAEQPAPAEAVEEPSPASEAEPAAPTWPAASLDEMPPTETEAPVAAPEPAVEPAAATAGERIEGRVTLNVSPITDFDRLLNLDGALGRLPNIRNVTLADYARDEVTFRIELGEPVSVDELARILSETSGHSILPVSVSEGHVRLQFTGIAA